MAIKVNTRVRLQTWVKVPPGTPKDGKVVRVEGPRSSEPRYAVTLDNGMLCVGLWESDLILRKDAE